MAVGMAADPDAHGRIAALEAALAPWDGGRSYLNFSEQRTDRARFFAPQTLRRLRAVKQDVDPDDVFRANHPL